MKKKYLSSAHTGIIYLIYNICFILATPIVILYLLKRSFKNKEYLKNWGERFAINLHNPADKPIIWIHTVSVGETKAAQRLIQMCQEQLSSYQILVTVMSVTGRAIAEKDYAGAIIRYLPYDNHYSMKKFYNTFKPSLGLIFETEIWPNMLKTAHDQNIPMLLVNARLSHKSCASYKKLATFSKIVMNYFSAILAQDDMTAQNFRQLGYQGDIKIIGSTKFDLTITPLMFDKIRQMQALLATEKPVVCFASSRNGEEKAFIEAMQMNLCNQEILYIIVPRHPERFTIVEDLLKTHEICYQRKSSMTALNPQTQVILGDTMGELLAYYAVSKVALIGGSFAELGGQNPLESIYMSVPVIFGPHMFNFTKISEMLLTAGVAYQVADISQAFTQINTMIQDQDNTPIKELCTQFIREHTGASQKILEYSQTYLI